MAEQSRPEKRRISEVELKEMLHHTEQSRLTLALISVICLAILTLVLVLVGGGVLLIVVGPVLVSVWIWMRLHEARLRGQAVEVRGENFPELGITLDGVCRQLRYTKKVSMFVVNDGDVNASLLRLFGKRILWVNAGLVETMGDPDGRAELEFVIGRFVGALKARHLRFGELMIVISSFERLAGLNLLIAPYLRATVLSGDQRGMVIAGDAKASVNAMSKLFIGKALATRLSLSATLEQALRQRYSIFRWLSIAFSSHPHMTDRFLNLVAFSQSRVATKHRLSGTSDPLLRTAAGLVPAPRPAAVGRPIGAPGVGRSRGRSGDRRSRGRSGDRRSRRRNDDRGPAGGTTGPASTVARRATTHSPRPTARFRSATSRRKSSS